jgi:hypothetical protein
MKARFDQIEITLSDAAIQALNAYGREICLSMQEADSEEFPHCWQWFTFEVDGIDPIFCYGEERSDVELDGNSIPVNVPYIKKSKKKA